MGSHVRQSKDLYRDGGREMFLTSWGKPSTNRCAMWKQPQVEMCPVQKLEMQLITLLLWSSLFVVHVTSFDVVVAVAAAIVVVIVTVDSRISIIFIVQRKSLCRHSIHSSMWKLHLL